MNVHRPTGPRRCAPMGGTSRSRGPDVQPHRAVPGFANPPCIRQTPARIATPSADPSGRTPPSRSAAVARRESLTLRWMHVTSTSPAADLPCAPRALTPRLDASGVPVAGSHDGAANRPIHCSGVSSPRTLTTPGIDSRQGLSMSRITRLMSSTNTEMSLRK